MSQETDFDNLRDLRDNALAIGEMPAFKRWKSVMHGQIEGRQREAVVPMKSLEDAMDRNYQNGEAAGMMAAVQMWTQLVEDLTDEIRRRQEEMENGTES